MVQVVLIIFSNEVIRMKMKTGLTIAALGMAGYGAWAAYKKMNPHATEDVKHAVNQMTKKVEKNIEGMM